MRIRFNSPQQHHTRKPARRRGRKLWRQRGRQSLALLLAAVMAGPAAPIVGLQSTYAQESSITEPTGSEAVTTIATSQPTVDEPENWLVSGDAELRGNRAWSWNEGSTRVVLLEQDVSLAVGTYGFRARRAVVRIDDEIVNGRTTHHLSMLLDDAQSLRGRGPTQVEGERVLVTASTTGVIDLVTNLLYEESRSSDPLAIAAGDRVAHQQAAMKARQAQQASAQAPISESARALRDQRRREIAGERQHEQPIFAAAQEVAEPRSAANPPVGDDIPLRPQDRVRASEQAAPPTVQPAGPRDQSVLPATGVVSLLLPPRTVVEPATPDRPEPALVLMGGVWVMYEDFETGRTVTLTADNAVIFLAKDVGAPGARMDIDPSTIRGLYLEDNVMVTDGQYTIRAPRVFYDVALDRAAVLDAVMFTWDERRQVPIYVRADRLRQESRASWSAERATLTTSEFAVPHFAIAARQVTVREEPDPRGGVQQRFSARGVTARLGGTPVFYWPGVNGSLEDLPIRRVSAGYSDRRGLILETAWDLFALTGAERPGNVDLLGRVDYQGNHGAGLGLNLDYDMAGMHGLFDGYLLPHDSFEDKIGGRDAVAFDGDVRGYGLWRHRQDIEKQLEISLEFAYVSDPTFLEEFFRAEAETSKPYETSLYLKRQEHDRAFTLLGSYHLNDFVPQTTVLQYSGSVTDKLPELGYHQIGTSLLGDRLTYYGETRASRVRLSFSEDTPEDRGFTNAQSLRLFGMQRDVSWEEAALAAGVPTDYRLRFDSRHELQAPLKLAMFDFVPYVTGRVTAYDEDFKAYRGEEDNFRLWGSVGTRIHTQFSRSFDDFDSRLLNLHRLRHVVEPNAHLFAVASTIGQGDLPVYDEDIEALAEGVGARIGVRNTFQTQRGGPGRWRSVDWLTIDTDLVLRSDDAATDQLIPRFYGHRPEFSRGGNHFHTEALWMISDTFASVAELIYDLEDDELATWRVGVSMQHTPRLATFADYAEIEALDSRLLSYGFTYEMTRKWSSGFRHTLDLGNNETNRALEVTLVRRLPQWQLVFVFQHDSIENEQTLGVVLVPQGLSTAAIRSPFVDRMPW